MIEPEYVYVEGQGWVAQKPERRKFPGIQGDLNLLCNTCGERAGQHNIKGTCPANSGDARFSKDEKWS